jgi:hypothetical protein
MTKLELFALGKIFEREVDETLPYQSKAKVFSQLQEKGMVEYVTMTLPGRFPVRVEGWVLTHSGRFEYCSSCRDVPDED